MGVKRTPRDDPDVRLMLRFQEGNVEAFQQLFRKYGPSVVNFIFHFTGRRARAEEITQEVFLQVYRFHRRYEPRARFATWLFKIATNLCLNEMRKPEYRMRMESLDSFPKEEEEPREIPDINAREGEDLVSAREMLQRVQNILRTLPEKQRVALILSRWEGLSYAEVAETLGCSEKAVKSLIFRASQTLKDGVKDFLEDDDV